MLGCLTFSYVPFEASLCLSLGASFPLFQEITSSSSLRPGQSSIELWKLI